jgi:hypothetical protein
MQEHLHIVGEAFDGLEAVQKAQELIPDLILLDIGLPNLNGIRAAVGVPAGICPQTRQTHRRTCPLPHSLLGLLPASYRGTAFQPCLQLKLQQMTEQKRDAYKQVADR